MVQNGVRRGSQSKTLVYTPQWFHKLLPNILKWFDWTKSFYQSNPQRTVPLYCRNQPADGEGFIPSARPSFYAIIPKRRIQTPAARSNTPERRVPWLQWAVSFSSTTKIVSTQSHHKFITPPTKRSNINAQQQPRQDRPLRMPVWNGPP